MVFNFFGNDHSDQTSSKKNPTVAINDVSPPADDFGIQNVAGQRYRALNKRNGKNEKTNVVDIPTSRGGEEALKVLEIKRHDATKHSDNLETQMFKTESPVSKYETNSAMEQLERIRGQEIF